MTANSLIPHSPCGEPIPKQVTREPSPRTCAILKLLTAQILLHKRVQEQLYRRVRPEVELILSTDPWREHVD